MAHKLSKQYGKYARGIGTDLELICIEICIEILFLTNSISNEKWVFFLI